MAAEPVEKEASTDWGALLELAKKDQEKFVTKGEKIVKRYRDERQEIDETMPQKRFNILWSNIRTLFPTIYAKKPQAQVERRYKDADPVARTASQILERALQYEIDHYPDYDSALRGAVLDRLLPGRGVAWVRYDKGPSITDDVGKKKLECTPVDYVFWKDFRHSPARTWEEVTWVARLVYMTKEEGVERFGDDWKDIPMVHEPIGLDDSTTQDTEAMKKAKVWEIWDKASLSVVWWAQGRTEPLQTIPDPLGLQGFFPCPKPLLATTTTDTLIPVADFLEYQDQALELDDMTQRIALLTKACKVVGVYDSSAAGVQRMLQEGTENTLVPVDQWAAFSEKGGIKGAVDWMPLDMVIQALNQLYVSREATKQIIYEITGISDIVRGASNAAETATAQRIKGNFAGLRLKETQGDVARFATDILNLKAQIICDLYRPETLAEMSGIMLTEDAQYAEEAIKLLKAEDVRKYRIDIATDSMVELDEQAEKESRVEFLTAAGGFLDKAVQGIQVEPRLAPLLGEMLMFGVRAFKAGRPVEAAFEQLVQQLNQPQAEKPDPEMQKVQAQQQMEQAKMQADAQAHALEMQQTAQLKQAELQQQMQLEQMKAQIEVQKSAQENALTAQREAQQAQLTMQAKEMELAHQAALEASKEAFERWKTELIEANKLTIAHIGQQTTMETAALSAETSKEVAKEGAKAKPEPKPEKPDTSMSDAIKELKEAMKAMSEMSMAPREIVRGPDGRATGVKVGGVMKKINRGADGRVQGI